MSWPKRLVTMVGLLAFAAGGLSASTKYQTDFGSSVGPCSPNPATTTSSSPIGPVTISCGPVNGSLDAAATAQPGHVGTMMKVSETPAGGNSVFSEFKTDVVFTSTDPNATTTMAALNLGINGSLNISGSANASWLATVNLGEGGFLYGADLDTSGVNCINGTCHRDMTLDGSDVLGLDSDVISGTLTTGYVLVPLNQPVLLEVELSVAGFGNPGSVDAEFLNSLDFPVGTGVFSFEESGVTANDADVYLVNNMFSPPTSAVPEPAAFVLLAGGLAGLLNVSRRKAR